MIEEILAKLKNAQGVLGVYLLDPDGSLLFVSSSLDNSPLELSGLFASLSGYLKEITENTKLGNFTDAIINSNFGRIIITKLRNSNILVVFVSTTSSLGTIRLTISNTINQLEKLEK